MMLDKTHLAAWQQFQRAMNLHRPESEADYLRLIEMMDQLTDSYAPNHPVYGALFDLIAIYIADWEKAYEPTFEETPGHISLQQLMQEHNVNQYQLAKEGIADQSTLSKILLGKRQISKNLARKLAERFHVSPAVFF